MDEFWAEELAADRKQSKNGSKERTRWATISSWGPRGLLKIEGCGLTELLSHHAKKIYAITAVEKGVFIVVIREILRWISGNVVLISISEWLWYADGLCGHCPDQIWFLLIKNWHQTRAWRVLLLQTTEV